MLKVSGLSLSIHGAPILGNVGFSMHASEVFGLVGESGSGKSMTALSLMGLLPRGSEVSGQALFGGNDLLALSERRLCAIRGSEIGMIFQEPMTALNPVQTIGDQVAETLLVHGKASRAAARDVARERLARVGLDPARFPLDRYPHELSGGQRQRVCIAMATALRPKLLIADEPTTALDVTTQAQILELLAGLVADEGMALMLITHDLAVVSRVATHVAVMQHGRIVEDGRTEALFRGHDHEYTRSLFAASSHAPRRKVQEKGAPLLSVRNVRRVYPGRFLGLGRRGTAHEAVKGVSFDLLAGESLGLVGESGCGKSTLARAILGLEPLQDGAITLDGDTVTAHPPLPGAVRRKMQVVFQDPYGSFNPRHRVARLVAEPFHLVGGRPPDWRAQVARALEAVGLKPSDMEKYPHEFSGGQRQRIAIARAILIHPRLVILDEAVSALDVQVRAQVLDLLAELQKRLGLSYLFISHDLTVVRAVTDRVVVMRAGEIVEQGPTEEVFGNPAHPYTRSLIEAAPTIPHGWLAPQPASKGPGGGMASTR